MDTAMVEVNKENYQDEVIKSDFPVVVDFWGPRCTACLALMPDIEALAQEYKGRVKFCKLNAAENRRLCIDLRVLALPTFLFYKAGELVSRLSGEEATKENIAGAVKSLL
jgi:thioredoxin 1